MRKIYSVRTSWTPEDVEFLKSFGFKVKPGSEKIAIPDEGPYLELLKVLQERGAWIYGPVFQYTEEELLAAPYCVLGSGHTSGYPKPENSHLEKTFDTSQMCPKCNQGRVQNNLFRVGKLSKHKLWGYCAWEFDPQFVADDIYDQVFAPYGIQRRPLLHASGKVVEGVSQLVIPVTDEPLDLYPYRYEICPECGRKRYLPGENIKHPYFPLHKHPLPGIYMTKEVVGQGRQVSHYMLVSADIIRQLLALKVIPSRYLQVPCTPDISQYWAPDNGSDRQYVSPEYHQ